MINNRYNNCIDIVKFAQYMRILEDELKKIKLKYKNIILYGAGSICNIIEPYLDRNVIAIVDKNISNNKISSPDRIKDYQFDCIIITAIEHQKEIIKYLVENFKINEEKIILLTQINFSIDNNNFIPKLETFTAGICTQKQLESKEYKKWIEICGEDNNKMHRKLWEFAFILDSLNRKKMLIPNKKGLGFAVGTEPLPSVLCNIDIEILATDLDFENANKKGWVNTNQHANNIEALNTKKLCSNEKFNQLCKFENVDMNNIPDSLTGFDFLWSACALEHLGSIELGLNYIHNSLKCLNPGGIAVHTLEYNCSSNTDTIVSGPTVLFRKQDIERIVDILEKDGHTIDKINFEDGILPYDKYVDFPPYDLNHHLKLKLDKYIVTSLGIVIQKKSQN